MGGLSRLGKVKSLIYGAVNPPVTWTKVVKKKKKPAGMVTLPELYWCLKDCNPFSIASVAPFDY